jgi:formylglycine-generating enzyme required for sulfatase activity
MGFPTDSGGGPGTGTTAAAFTGLTADGSATATTTKLTLTFDKDITGLSAEDITLTGGSTGAVKGSLARTVVPGVYELAVSGITAGGSVTVAVSKSGYTITGGPKTVTVYRYVSPTDIAAAFTNLTADGSAAATTAKLTLTFDKDITGLSAEDIALTSGSTGAVKGSLARTGRGIYELAVSGISAGGSITVSASKSGYAISGSPKTVTVYFVTPAVFTNLTADGSAAATTAKLTLTFDKDITGLSAADITLTAGSTWAVKGSLPRPGTGVYALAVSGIRAGGSVTVAVSKFGYNITDGAKTVTVYWTPPVIEMIYVPGGSFQMGNPDTSVGYGDERPVHTVTLTGFSMSKYQVTQAQYQAVMGSNPSYFSSNPASGEVQGNRPVETVSWYDAIVFCNKLSIAEGLTPAYRISGSTNPSDWGAVPTSSNSTWNAAVIVSGSTGYRLPTEVQWEYAAKGGNGTPGNYTYSGSNTIDNVAWYDDNSDYMTHEVGKKAANGLGIYDMSGNVVEWCWDWYDDYTSGAQNNPAGPASGSYRVIRGGYWGNSASFVRSVFRNYGNPYDRGSYGGLGFRLVRP